MARHNAHHVNAGDHFGDLLVLGYAGYGGTRNPLWLCRCLLCNGEVKVAQCNLGSGNSTKCRWCKYAEHVDADSAIRKALGVYQRQARNRNLTFELTFDTFKGLVSECCFYCGIEPRVNSYSDGVKISVPMTGVDRLDSSLGYSPDNCVPCCGTCNRAKLDRTPQEFIDWIRRAEFHLRSHNG